MKEILGEINGWVLCSEKLPEEPPVKIRTIEDMKDAIFNGFVNEYNVTIKGALKATTLYYAGDGYWYDEVSEELCFVVAWQPLPEAYAGG